MEREPQRIRGIQASRKVIRQLIHSVRAHGSYLFALAFIFAIGPVLGQAQAPPAYTISTVAGQVGVGGNYSGDGGAATSASLWGPAAIIFDASGNFYIADADNDLIRKVNSSGSISTYAGNCPSSGCAGAFAGDKGPATSARLNHPSGLAFDSGGNLYIADTNNYEIRKVSGGTITTVAGNNGGGANYAGDLGLATSASLWDPPGVVVDSAGNIYIADAYNNVIRVVCVTQTPFACTNSAFTSPTTGSVQWVTGDINTFAGNDVNSCNAPATCGAGYTGDGGIATGALLNNPSAVLLDASGNNLYISDSGNNSIRVVNTSGIITTVVGGLGPLAAGYSGDGGPALGAQLNNPKGIALDSAGNLYIADTDNSVIRMVNTKGIITTIAGTGKPGSGGNLGPAASAQLNFPSAVWVQGGNIYIADSGNNAIRLLTPAPQVPQIGNGGVVNAASYSAQVAPGSIAAVFGTFFLTSPLVDTSLPLETSLQNLSLQFTGGAAAPLYYVSGTQVNLQVPWELTGDTTASLTATLNGMTGAAQSVTVAPVAPAIFTTNSQGTGQGAIQDASYHLVDSSNPATSGSTTILIYCTGLGPVTNQPATGAAASTTDLDSTVTMPTVTIGGIPAATPSFSGLAPGYVGLYQVNVQVPAGVAAGSAVPVVISMNGVNSNTATIAVQ